MCYTSYIKVKVLGYSTSSIAHFIEFDKPYVEDIELSEQQMGEMSEYGKTILDNFPEENMETTIKESKTDRCGTYIGKCRIKQT